MVFTIKITKFAVGKVIHAYESVMGEIRKDGLTPDDFDWDEMVSMVHDKLTKKRK